MAGKKNCEMCANYTYDEDWECYVCDINLDEDEMVRFMSDSYYDCPYFRNGDEYMVVRKQMWQACKGWEIRAELDALRKTEPIDKDTFGSTDLGETLAAMNEEEETCSITLVGLCTDICVILNALLIKAYLPGTVVTVDASCCAQVTPESHENA